MQNVSTSFVPPQTSPSASSPIHQPAVGHDCPICLEAFANKKVKKTECGHHFHLDCLTTALHSQYCRTAKSSIPVTQRTTCPLCTSDLTVLAKSFDIPPQSYEGRLKALREGINSFSEAGYQQARAMSEGGLMLPPKEWAQALRTAFEMRSELGFRYFDLLVTAGVGFLTLEETSQYHNALGVDGGKKELSRFLRSAFEMNGMVGCWYMQLLISMGATLPPEELAQYLLEHLKKDLLAGYNFSRFFCVCVLITSGVVERLPKQELSIFLRDTLQKYQHSTEQGDGVARHIGYDLEFLLMIGATLPQSELSEAERTALEMNDLSMASTLQHFGAKLPALELSNLMKEVLMRDNYAHHDWVRFSLLLKMGANLPTPELKEYLQKIENLCSGNNPERDLYLKLIAASLVEMINTNEQSYWTWIKEKLFSYMH